MHLIININLFPFMEFFDEFLKINRKETVSLPRFLLSYDLTHKTVFSLTLNHENTLINILKKILRNFLQETDISTIPQISKKIDTLLTHYLLYLEKHELHIPVRKIGLYLQQSHCIKYWQYMLYFSDALWKKAGIYDADHNFLTRRITLARMANEIYSKALYGKEFDPPKHS